jgi:hypothetical protein
MGTKARQSGTYVVGAGLGSAACAAAKVGVRGESVADAGVGGLVMVGDSGSVMLTRSVVVGRSGRGVSAGGWYPRESNGVSSRPRFWFEAGWDNTDHKYSRPLLFVHDERRVTRSVGERMRMSAGNAGRNVHQHHGETLRKKTTHTRRKSRTFFLFIGTGGCRSDIDEFALRCFAFPSTRPRLHGPSKYLGPGAF